MARLSGELLVNTRLIISSHSLVSHENSRVIIASSAVSVSVMSRTALMIPAIFCECPLPRLTP